jgi:peptidoglycan/LPS O-acetylase OafA/YrhL
MYIGSLVASRVLLHFVPGFTSHTMPVFGNVAILFSFLTAFLAGCTFWCFREKIPRSRLLFAICVALLFVCTKNGFPIYLAVCAVYCLFYLASSEKLRFFRGATADFSYGLYLYAYPVQQLIRMNHPEISPMVLFVEATAITCVFALASWYLVEAPCLKLKRGLGKKAEKTAPPAVKIAQPV